MNCKKAKAFGGFESDEDDAPAITHTICEPCSEIVDDYILWEGHTQREAQLIKSIESLIDLERKYYPVSKEELYLEERNVYAVAADTDWTVEDLRTLLKQSPEVKWRIRIAGIHIL